MFNNYILIKRVCFMCIGKFIKLCSYQANKRVPFGIGDIFLIRIKGMFMIQILHCVMLVTRGKTRTTRLRGAFSSIRGYSFILYRRLFTAVSDKRFGGECEGI